VGVFVDELLHSTGITPNEIDAVAVGKGPGSYTGLRIGVSFAKGLCYGLQKPLIAIGSLDALVAVAREEHKAGIVTIEDWDKACLCPMVDARRMEVYAQIFDSEGNTWDNMLDAAGKWMSDSNSLFRDLRKIYRFRIKGEEQKKRK
jgi:tRNA threonylcarbamoyladenosine biosynthesis protein TsaB